MTSVVSYRGRAIDLAPYLEGFPYLGFEALPDAKLLLYFHDLPDRRLMKAQPLDRPFDLSIGQTASDVDWNKQSWLWSPQYRRAERALYLSSDESNDEVLNVYRLCLDSGELARITDVPYVKTFELSPAQDRLAYVARYAEGPIMRAELRVRDLRSGEDKLIVADTADFRLSWGKILWRGEDHVLVQANVADDRNRSNLACVDLARPTLEPLLDATIPRSSVEVLDDWLDERTALIASNESGYHQVYRLNVRTGALVRLTDEPYDYRSATMVRVGDRVLVVTVGDRIEDSPLRVLDPRTGETVWEQVAEGSVYLLKPGRGVVYATSTSLSEKWAMWRLTIGEEVRWQRISSMPSEVVRATSHARVERIAYPTFDVDPKTGSTRRIHAFLLVPKDLPPPERRQAFVLAFYGGGNAYYQDFQILAQAGFIVLSPAVRGSFGFGREFYSLIDRDLGGNEMLDLIYGARFLAERLELQPRQIGVFGGSHGGYATVRALTLPSPINGREESFDWGFGWAHAGFYDITTFWRDCNIPDWVTQKAGDPRTEREKLLDRSPLTHAARLTAPLYLTHGDQDNRVPVAEGRALAARLAQLGCEFRYDEFAGHGHALKGIATQRRLWHGLFGYLEGRVAPDDRV